MKYRNLVPKPTGYERTISRTADPRNTVKSMMRIATENAWQVSELADALEKEGGDRLENLWEWVRENIRYVNDPAKSETLRTPARTVHDGKGDCDCMSILISAVLLNWKVPHLIRVVDVKGKGWGHVYIVALDGGREVCMDTVPEIRHFGHEHFYKDKFDTHMDTVELGGLGAIDQEELAQARAELLNTLQAMQQAELETDEEIALRDKEVALLKFAINALSQPQAERRAVLERAYQNSVLLQDVYISFLQADLGDIDGVDGLDGLFSSIKKGLDKLGETKFGKMFRSARDTALEATGLDKVASAAGKAVNNAIDKGKTTTTSTTTALPGLPSKTEEPQPPATPPTEEPKQWYKTNRGMVVIGVGALAVIGIIFWIVKANQSKRLAGIRRRRRKPTAAVAAKRRKRTRKALSGIKMTRRATATAAPKKRKRKTATATANKRKRKTAKK